VYYNFKLTFKKLTLKNELYAETTNLNKNFIRKDNKVL